MESGSVITLGGGDIPQVISPVNVDISLVEKETSLANVFIEKRISAFYILEKNILEMAEHLIYR